VEKSARGQVHRLFKGETNGLTTPIDTTTVQLEDGSSVIRLRSADNKNRNHKNNNNSHSRKRERDAWGRGRGDHHSSGWLGGKDRPFLEFILYKENIESHGVLNLIARFLHLHVKNFDVSGTKDKRGCTTQFCTAFKLHPSRLAGLNQRLCGARLQVTGYSTTRRQLGALRGNNFTVVLRAVQGANQVEIDTALATLRTNGFINYFGLQRFGSTSLRTHTVGAALCRGDWIGAIDLIMAPTSGDGDLKLSAIRQGWLDHRDPAETLKVLPRYLVAENALMRHLSGAGRGRGGGGGGGGQQQHSTKKDYVGALKAIPRGLRLMYMHGLQSYLWNKAASYRMQNFDPLRPIEGDLVIPLDSELDEDLTTLGGGAEEPDGTTGGGENEDKGGEDDNTTEVVVKESAKFAHVRYVTAEEAAAGTFTIDQVVLPLPGRMTVFPRHSTADVYRAEAASLGIPMVDPQGGHEKLGVHHVKEFCMTQLPGDYRRIVYRPKDLTWRTVRYSDPIAEIEPTQLQRLQDAGKDVANGGGEGSNAKRRKVGACAVESKEEEEEEGLTTPTETEKEKVQDGQVQGGVEAEDTYLGLVLSFFLPSSSYATMLIREATKMSTALEFQKKLNVT